ncbi:WD40/YVTN repeat-like-containing domain superfamily [Sesbania bispinosa]|nr:WD40/YVTN repeat-like-containing domain superfamily [Sesbania bispinosa]
MIMQAEVKKSHQELCILDILIDNLKDIDFAPLLDVCMNLDTAEIEAVDVRNESSCVLNAEYALSLMRAINQKLRVVELQDVSFGKDFLRDISQRGLTCQVMTLRSSRFRKLNLMGEFMHMHTLNLDFSSSLTSFQEDCFNCMPNLACLSMCETRITNLWTTVAALSKLPSLVELRFQYWQYCNDAGTSFNSSNVKSDSTADFGVLDKVPFIGESYTDTRELTDPNFSVEDPLRNFYFFDEEVVNHDVQNMVEDSSDDSEIDFNSHHHRYWLSDVFPGWNLPVPLQSEFTLHNEDGEESSRASHTGNISDVSMKYMSRHASPICHEKHYREFMIASLPNLKILDNLPIRKIDKERATGIFSQYFEYLPYRWKHKESVVNILQKREIKSGHIKVKSSKRSPSYASGTSQYFYTRSLSAAKLGSSTWPFLHPLSLLGCELDKGFRPRQFEYHPTDSSLMVFGTLDGEVVVINHEDEHIVSYIPSLGAMNSVLGLCWLKKYPSKDVKMWDLRQKPIHPCFTASSSRGNVMVCFSPDDQYILASAVDNEVRQFLAVDGRLHLVFDIAPTESSQNYTRSYYMNERDYIISGSCDEHVVRICCAQTGRRLRDISLEGRSLGSSMFVQSLRGDPFRDFNMSVLAAYMRPGSKSEIVKVNLLASSGHAKDDSDDRGPRPSHSKGA